MAESQGLLAEEKRKNAEGEDIYIPSEEAIAAARFHKGRIEMAKQSRNQTYREFDGLTFIADYYSNKDATNSYLRPKKNDDEVRVVGGATEKRMESLVNDISSMNFQSEFSSYDDEDAIVPELGEAIGMAVKRSRQIEEDEDIMHDGLWEFCTQRAIFIEEMYEETEWRGQVTGQYRKRLRSALEVLLGDVTLPAYRFQEQPFICTYDRMTIQSAGRVYKDFENFKYVRGGMDLSTDVYGIDITFRIGFLAENEVEIVKYMSVPDDETQVYINGVPMFDVGEKMPWSTPTYPVAMGIPKRMGKHFSYGRSGASAMKYLQALDDEMVRNAVRKFRQAIEPPKAVLASNRVYSRDIFNAGSISYGVDAGAFKNLVEPTGISAGEEAVMRMVKSMQDELAARGGNQLGVSGQGPKQTATEIVQSQQNAIKMLGELVINWTRFVREVDKLRMCNILEHATKPIGKKIDPVTKEIQEEYQRFTLTNEPLPNGKSGDYIVQFADKGLTDEESEQLLEAEDELEKQGKPVKVKVLDAKMLRDYKFRYVVTVVSKPKESDDLHRLMFKDQIADALQVAQVAGQQLNGQRIVDEFERKWRIHDWFMKPEEAALAQEPAPLGPEGATAPEGPAGAQAPAGGGIGPQMKQGITSSVRKEAMPNPTLKTAVGATEGARP